MLCDNCNLGLKKKDENNQETFINRIKLKLDVHKNWQSAFLETKKQLQNTTVTNIRSPSSALAYFYIQPFATASAASFPVEKMEQRLIEENPYQSQWSKFT